MLVDVMDFKNQQQLEIEDLEYGFSDIESHEYKEDIIYAKVYNILDTEGETFRPDEPATREFAAVTTVKALQFNSVQDIICDDVSEITYLKEVGTAISMELMSLEENKFYPFRSLTPNDNPETRDINVDEEGSIGGIGTVKLSIGEEITDNISLSGEVSFSLPKVSYKADVDFGFLDIDVNNVYLKFDVKTEVKGEVSVKKWCKYRRNK